jgi:hypothetical protein
MQGSFEPQAAFEEAVHVRPSDVDLPQPGWLNDRELAHDCLGRRAADSEFVAKAPAVEKAWKALIRTCTPDSCMKDVSFH